jgi:transcription-repair coupling factor (superfamily II helicase)
LKGELRDRFGPLPPAVETLLQVGELKLLAAEKGVHTIEVKEHGLMLTRQGDFITLGGEFPRLTKKQIPARLKEKEAAAGAVKIVPGSVQAAQRA